MEDYNFDDIINLPHHVSKVHGQMPLIKRAAQFAPFAALRGYKEALAEVERQTEERKELSEDEFEILNRKLTFLLSKLNDHITTTVTYFVPDDRKPGGAYLTCKGYIKAFNGTKKLLTMDDGTQIPVSEIFKIDSDIFDEY